MADIWWRIASASVTVVAAAALGGVLFASAGTLGWTGAWVWLAIWVVAGAIMALTLDPGLMKERIGGMSPRRERTTADLWGIVTAVLFIAWLPIMGLDAIRYGWSAPAIWTKVAGAVVFLAANVLIFFTLRANRFASSAVRVQDERGQTVITRGPYKYVRHPMYSGVLLYLPGTALLLGSLYGLTLSVLMVFTLALRTWFEDRLLRDELAGYRDYAQRVPYRLIPQLW